MERCASVRAESLSLSLSLSLIYYLGNILVDEYKQTAGGRAKRVKIKTFEITDLEIETESRDSLYENFQTFL